jgi:fucose 4-O-acetylase-like acetyltransferase
MIHGATMTSCIRRKGNREIAALSGLGILLVVIGHPVGTTDETARAIAKTSWSYAWFLSLHHWIYTFHMPLFFAISGVVYSYARDRKGAHAYGAFVLNRAKRLLVPYVLISCGAFAVKAACVGSAGIGQLLSSAKRMNPWLDFGIMNSYMAFVKCYL